MTHGESSAQLNGKLQQIRSVPAFATFIDEYAVPDCTALNAGLLEEVASWRNEEDGITATNHLGWHSSRTFFERREPAIVALARHIKTALAHSVRRYWADFDPTRHPVICEGWGNINPKGAFNSPHNHEGAHLSGSYYVSVPESREESSGALEFLNPIGMGWLKLPTGKPMTLPTLFVPPKPGWMVIFPSYLRHWVYPNQEEDERVSIAFNLRLVESPARSMP